MPGLFPTALKDFSLASCPKCERCGCGLVCDPAKVQVLICSTCAPAEIAELRQRLTQAHEVGELLAEVAANAHNHRGLPS